RPRTSSLCRNSFLCQYFLPESLRLPCNQIANVDFLLRSVVSGGLHRASYFDGLQFADICVECVWLTEFTFSPEEFGLARVLFRERWFCSASLQYVPFRF
ncbi:hypothetical protein A2U01_0041948, partial [Trifolium medium]|nr:hypothetical protein [Trifolium medium]